MNICSRVFRTLTYIAMVWFTFVTLVLGINMLKNESYFTAGCVLLILTLGGFVATIILDILKLRWSAFIVLSGAVVVHVFIAYSMTNRRVGIESAIFYRNHAPILILIVLFLVCVLCYKKYIKDQRGIVFRKTEKDREQKELDESSTII